MRPRIRTIKPELFRDQKLQRLPREQRLLFIGLFVHADDHGRLEADPALIRSVVFPCDQDVTVKKVASWLSSLDEHGFIRLYQAGSEPFLDLPKWTRHQKVDRPSDSLIPPYDEREESTNGRAGRTVRVPT